MLTRKQYELLMFINERLRESGVPPSYDEMKDALNLKSKSGIHRLISALEERGFIRRLPHRARALEILRLPDTSQHRPLSQDGRAKGFTPSIIDGKGARAGTAGITSHPSVSGEAAAEAAAFCVPLLGRIAAGTPIEALQEDGTYVEVPSGIMRRGEHYALEVKGDSMIEAGIFDGDTVVIQRRDTAENGDIVVALVHDSEATLKRLRKRGDSIALEAANPAYETRIFRPSEVKVQGRLVGLIRRY